MNGNQENGVVAVRSGTLPAQEETCEHSRIDTALDRGSIIHRKNAGINHRRKQIGGGHWYLVGKIRRRWKESTADPEKQGEGRGGERLLCPGDLEMRAGNGACRLQYHLEITQDADMVCPSSGTWGRGKWRNVLEKQRLDARYSIIYRKNAGIKAGCGKNRRRFTESTTSGRNRETSGEAGEGRDLEIGRWAAVGESRLKKAVLTQLIAFCLCGDPSRRKSRVNIGEVFSKEAQDSSDRGAVGPYTSRPRVC
ncbi:hypothetical protein B0H10DRAFT_2197788 [Mycena sp. CBHHK59/15]|nr:hypothetical protein B0H10DRAFT_2197788 [Mycena sp. CBHHK59/15]